MKLNEKDQTNAKKRIKINDKNAENEFEKFNYIKP